MLSTLYQERFAPNDGSENPSKGLKSWFSSYRIDEIAIFALVAVAIVYIAVASCWFVY